MILLLDTSGGKCELTLVDSGKRSDYSWQADRELARGLHRFLNEKLSENGKRWQDIGGIGAFKGPGSFTGLRIGLTVLNGLADSLDIPIVGTTGQDWRDAALERLENSENDSIVMPDYGSEARITKPRK